MKLTLRAGIAAASWAVTAVMMQPSIWSLAVLAVNAALLGLMAYLPTQH